MYKCNECKATFEYDSVNDNDGHCINCAANNIEFVQKRYNINQGKSIKFDTLMDGVQYVDTFVNSKYVLQLDGKRYTFNDTAEVVPYVEKKLGYKVIMD